MQTLKLTKRKRRAQEDGNKPLLASICIDLADLYIQKGNYEDAIVEYSTVAEIYEALGKVIDYARANRMIGEAYAHLREFDQALHYQEIYLKIAKQQNDKVEEQRALATIGHTYLTNYLETSDNPDKTCLKLAYKSFIKSLTVSESLEKVINNREHKDMTARLLANLGVVEECRGNYNKGVELVQRSINICKAHDIFEQLERNYTLLGSLYVRTKEYDKAIHQYNLAIEVAGRLKDKIALMCSSLSAKAHILVKLSDFRGAKSVLLKAHKLNCPVDIEKENIQQSLKIVAAMCYAEDSLLTTGDLDYSTKKHLYEKLGDGACALKNYTIAIDYYYKMLESAKNNGENGLQLSPCLISLAETYRDDKQFEMAIRFFKEEHSTCQPNTKGSVTTLLNICDCMEAAGKDITEIQTYYNQAKNESIKSYDQQLQYKVLSRYLGMLRKYNETAKVAEVECELMKISDSTYESNSEPLDEQETLNIGDDISISNITDVSDESDTENLNLRSARKRTKSCVIQRNDKGETKLHTACINGNMTVVKHLLDQGHPVNVRDNCGWLPIHEACICGHVEIVTMLINKGATLNDRGGTLCNGMTPMHDAATNGHLKVMQLLLDKGASTTAKNDMGELPLQILQKWRSNNQLDEEEQLEYDRLLRRLKQDAERIGFTGDVNVKDASNSAIVLNEEPEYRRRVRSEVEEPKTRERPKPKIGNLRRNISFDEDIDRISNNSNEELPDKEPNCVTYDYKRLMESLKHPNRTEVVQKRKSGENSRQSAYLTLRDDENDWLEDDVCNQPKKKKISHNDVISTTTMRTNSSKPISRHSSSLSLKSKSSFSEDFDVPDDFLDSDFNTVEIADPLDSVVNVVYDSDDQFKSNSSTKKKKTQSSLIQQGFTRTHSFSSSNVPSLNKTSTIPKHQTRIDNFGHSVDLQTDSRSMQSTYRSNATSNMFNSVHTLSVDVRIDGKLYRVPVPASEIYVLTFKWLADEAAKRYGKKECLKPTLELETKNGAVLADDDTINILFSGGSSKTEEIQSRVLNWNLPSLADRYKAACINANTEHNENIVKILNASSTSLSLANLGLKSPILAPVCKAINRQNNLHSLDLSGNLMQNDSIHLLCLSLPSLNNLCLLNLSSNTLSYNNLELLADMFTRSSNTILENLINLDLSYNPLRDESFKSLAIITRYLKLQVLTLIDVNFTSNIFNIVSNGNIELCLDYIVNLNISYNSLNKQEISTFMSWLNPQNVQVLNVSDNLNLEAGLTKEVINWLQTGNEGLKLQTLNLSRCEVTDLEVYELLRVLEGVRSFRTINLSYNQDLTAMSLRRLVNHYSLENLNLSGCQNIFKYFGDCTENTWIFTNLKHLKVSFQPDSSKLSDVLKSAWKNKYQEEACIMDLLRGFLQLSTSKR